MGRTMFRGLETIGCTEGNGETLEIFDVLIFYFQPGRKVIGNGIFSPGSDIDHHSFLMNVFLAVFCKTNTYKRIYFYFAAYAKKIVDIGIYIGHIIQIIPKPIVASDFHTDWVGDVVLHLKPDSEIVDA